MRAVMCAAVLATLGAGACGDDQVSIRFDEVDATRVPEVSQVMYVPNNGLNSGLGAAVGDIDGDGRPDLYLAGGGLYRNVADGDGFRLQAAGGELDGDPVWVGAAFGDYDRDGDLDLARCGQGGVELWANDGSGGFADVTGDAGVAGDAADVSLSVAWGDLDGDGWLDLAVANYGFSLSAADMQVSRIYLNQRDGSFAELTAPLAGREVRAWVAAFADLDDDGRVDLYLGDDTDIPFIDTSKPRHDLALLDRGLDGGGAVQLVESSAELGLDRPRATMGLAVGDTPSGQGWQLMITDIEATWLLRSDGPGLPYRDVTAASGIAMQGPDGESWWQWGCTFRDLDGDGREDALVGQAAIFPIQAGVDFVGPVLLHADGDRYALQRNIMGGQPGQMNARAIVPVDLDLDGDDDAVIAPFFSRFRFFANQTPPRRAIRVALAATVSAPGAAGAVVTADAGGRQQRRMVVSGGQPHSSAEPVVDLGLGDADAADLTIRWPSGAVQQVAGVAAGGLTVITEPGWIEISDPRPAADGASPVSITVDATAVGGGPGSAVAWRSPGVAVDAVAGDDGIAEVDLPPRSQAGPVQGTLSVDGRELPAHPAVDYQ